MVTPRALARSTLKRISSSWVLFHRLLNGFTFIHSGPFQRFADLAGGGDGGGEFVLHPRRESRVHNVHGVAQSQPVLAAVEFVHAFKRDDAALQRIRSGCP